MTESLVELLQDLSPAMREKLAELLQVGQDPIAVIGVGCRMPGAAEGPDGYWDLLASGRDGIREVPRERWAVERYYDPDPTALGKMSTRWGGFIDDVDRFDADYFGISPREAARMDPQQRILLEVAMEALDDSGQPAGKLAGRPVGVFVGICASDYAYAQFGNLETLDAYAATGNAHSIVANRLSYVLDLRGPSVAVDTACSSSLVAVHLAAQSLQARESSLAIVGGVHLILAPYATIAFSKAQMMAPDGRCKTFDARADGFVRGEGCGVVVLKRLSDALADGDPIRAVIRGTAVNQDGRSNGLMAPNGLSQQVVIRQALARGGLSPDAVTYVEAHGTGTSLGDPIEVEALAAVFGAGRPAGQVCVLGSVKTNVGHLEGAAGIAGFIKVVLALQNESIPPHLHFRSLNPNISLNGTPFVIPTRARPWPAPRGSRFAGVSSFGFGGSNAHVVLGDAPLEVVSRGERVPARGASSSKAQVVVLSARSANGLKAYGEHMAAWLGQAKVELCDLAYSAGVRRTLHDQRLAIVASTPAGLLERMRSHLSGETHPDVATGAANAASRVGFVFSGQGAQWPRMGRTLRRDEPAFRERIEASAAAFTRAGARFDLVAEIDAAEDVSRFDLTEVAQAAVFATQVALAALWRSWGVTPAVTVGHSLGEVAAATVSGALSLDGGARIVFERSRLMQRARGSGKMVAVEAEANRVLPVIETAGCAVDVAAYNAPAQTVLTGRPTDIEKIVELLTREGIACRPLRGTFAFHSRQMDPFVLELRTALDGLAHGAAEVPVYSTVTGQRLEATELGPGYWARNLREPVRFVSAIEHMLRDGISAFVEIGPHAELGASIMETARTHGAEAVVLASLRRNSDERAALLRAVAGLHVRGVDVDLGHLAAEGRHVAFPRAPWSKTRHWMSESPSVTPVPRPSEQQTRPEHPLLGSRLDLALDATVFQAALACSSPPWLADHQLYDRIIVPAVAYLEAVFAGARETFGPGPIELGDVVIQEALSLPDGVAQRTQLILEPAASADSGRGATFVYASEDQARHRRDAWRRHVSGTVRVGGPMRSVTSTWLKELRARCTEPIDVQKFYEEAHRRGFRYGPAFRGVRELWCGPTEALGSVSFDTEIVPDSGSWHFHPCLLEGCLQVVGALAGRVRTSEDDIYIPIGIERLFVFGRPTRRMWSVASIRAGESREAITADLQLLDDRGGLVVEVSGMLFKRASHATLGRANASQFDKWLHAVDWRKWPGEPAGSENRMTGALLVVGHADGLGPAVVEAWRGRGREATYVPSGTEACNRLWESRSPPSVAYGALVCLTAIHARIDDQDDATAVESKLRLATEEPLGLAQSLAQMEGRAVPRLVLATRGAQRVDGSAEHVDPAQRALWGLSAVLALEHPEFWGAVVDLESDPVGGEADRIADAIERIADEDRIAFRGEHRLVPRLVAAAKQTGTAVGSADSVRIRPDAAYLVTGGLGGIGLALAGWLVDRGARHLLLLGRRNANDKQRRVLQTLEASGAQIVVRSVDVGDADMLAQAFREVGDDMPPLGGVFHAAGVLDDATLVQQTWERFARVVAPKARGAWNLHRLTKHLSLDFFVLFSSAAGIIGSPGQSNYALANSFLDGLAEYRRQSGLPALSIAWGAWQDVGMAASLMAVDGPAAQNVSSRGVGAIPAEAGVHLAGRLAASPATNVAVLPIDWEELARRLPFVPPLLREVTGASRPPKAPAPELDLLALIAETPPDEQKDRLSTFLRGQVAAVLGRTSSADIEPHRGFFDLGLDSLMALELKNRLQTGLGRTISVNTLFEHPTIDALSEHLIRSVWPSERRNSTQDRNGSSHPAPATHPVVVDDEILAAVSQMSDDEVDRMLLELEGSAQ